HAYFFLSGWAVETREFRGTPFALNRVFPQPARLNGFETRSAPFTSFSQARPQRVDHPYFAVLLTCPEVFGIQGRGTRAFGCLENQRVPVGDLVARLDFQRLNDRFRTVDDDFPA